MALNDANCLVMLQQFSGLENDFVIFLLLVRAVKLLAGGSLGMLVTNFLTDCLVNLVDVTLACEDDNSKLVEVVRVAHIDDEKCVDNSLVQIWKVKFGHKAKFLSTRFQGLVKILK